MSEGTHLEGHAYLVWTVALRAKRDPASVSNEDIHILHMVEEATPCQRLRALAAQTIADVMIHCPADVALAASTYDVGLGA